MPYESFVVTFHRLTGIENSFRIVIELNLEAII